MAYDTIIIGAGAAGLMCAMEAGKRGQNVLLLEKGKAIGEKIRISGGGRCNFTNLHATPTHYLSRNPHFCVSALTRFTQHDFIRLVEKHHIAYHEKTLGQLFCDGSSKQIIHMLQHECDAAKVEMRLNTEVQSITKAQDGFLLELQGAGKLYTATVVIATGGPSIPKMGASGWGYDVARQFGLKLVPPVAALVPFTLPPAVLEKQKQLAGVSLEVEARCGSATFREGMVFTHRGLSGPAILQVSSYWQQGEPLFLNLLPGTDALAVLKHARTHSPKQEIHTALAGILPKKLALHLCEMYGWHGKLADYSNEKLASIAATLENWQIMPSGTEGYRTAEVTKGGVDTDELSSKTFECKKVPGLFFIGEVVDVTGHLGGFNFQWAWSSGHAAGQFV